MAKKRRTFFPRVVGGQVVMPAVLRRLHKYLLGLERVEAICDEMRAAAESGRPELAQKLPPRETH